MEPRTSPIAVRAADIPPRAKPTNYPEPFASRVAGREKRVLGDLEPGMCAGFHGGTGDAHHLVNRGAADVVYLEIGDRTAGDESVYPDDDLHVMRTADAKLSYTRKNGSAY
jgi:hypothetical protein